MIPNIVESNPSLAMWRPTSKPRRRPSPGPQLAYLLWRCQQSSQKDIRGRLAISEDSSMGSRAYKDRADSTTMLFSSDNTFMLITKQPLIQYLLLQQNLLCKYKSNYNKAFKVFQLLQSIYSLFIIFRKVQKLSATLLN